MALGSRAGKLLCQIVSLIALLLVLCFLFLWHSFEVRVGCSDISGTSGSTERLLLPN